MVCGWKGLNPIPSLPATGDPFPCPRVPPAPSSLALGTGRGAGAAPASVDGPPRLSPSQSSCSPGSAWILPRAAAQGGRGWPCWAAEVQGVHRVHRQTNPSVDQHMGMCSSCTGRRQEMIYHGLITHETTCTRLVGREGARRKLRQQQPLGQPDICCWVCGKLFS